MSLTITGASGQLSTAVAKRVAQIRGGMTDLVLTTRTPDAVADTLRGAEIRYADFADPASLRAAFSGTSRLLLVSADDITARGAWHRSAIDAARDAGVRHIVYTSMVEPVAENPAVIAESHRATEEHLAASGVPHTVLRCALYADFQVFEAAEAIAAGAFRHNRGDGGCSYVAREDCAAVAAAVLTSGDIHGGVIDITGPEALTAAELAALYSQAAGAEVRPIDLSDEAMTAALEPAEGTDPDGHAQYGAALAVSLGRAIREGFFDGVTTTVRELTGNEPRTVAELLDEHRQLLQDIVTRRSR